MYRAVGYKVTLCGIDTGDEAAMKDMLAETDIDFSKGDIIEINGYTGKVLEIQ